MSIVALLPVIEGGKPWTPKKATSGGKSPLVWYDFSDITTLYQDTAKTSPVTADAQVIKAAVDKANGLDVTEASAPPTYKAAIQNGLSVARFSGTVQLQRAIHASLSRADGSVFMVLVPRNVTSPGTQQAYMGFSDTATTTNNLILNGVSGVMKFQATIAGATDGINGSTTMSANNPYIVEFHSNGMAYIGYVNGTLENLTVAAGSNNGYWTSDVAAIDNMTLGRLIRTSAVLGYNGDEGEVLYYAYLTDAEKSQVRTYLNNKWAAY